ncbi:MAG: galactitol-1-phosphate 5-dehydrogenase [Anaerolineae bacterium]
MKAVVLENKGLLTYKEVPTPTVQPGHALLQVRAVSICGSDIMRYIKGHRMYNLILGHECAGVVVQVGEGVSRAWVGKHVAVIPLVPDLACEQCRLGHYSACHHYSFIGSRQDGGYAEYVHLPEKCLLVLPESLEFEDAALIEPATVARHILDRGRFQPGQTVAVLGAGSVGLMAVQWLRILDAGCIICTDVVQENLEIAKALGAHVTLNPQQVDVQARVKELTGDGVDLALEVAGVPQTLAQTIQVTRPRGNIVCGGNQPLDASQPMSFIEDLMRKELHLSGCFMSYSAPFPGHEWTDSVDALVQDKLKMNPMISHRYPLSAAVQVFQDIAAHNLTHRKIILLPEEPTQ